MAGEHTSVTRGSWGSESARKHWDSAIGFTGGRQSAVGGRRSVDLMLEIEQCPSISGAWGSEEGNALADMRFD